MILKSDAKTEEKLICWFKGDKNLVNFDLNIRNFQNSYFDFLLWKVCNVWPRKVQRSCLSYENYLSWWKIWGKTDLLFRKWHEEYGKFSPEHLNVSKLGLWLDLFIQKRKYMSLEVTEELCVMTMKNDAKFEGKLTCRSKSDPRNLTNFDPSTQKSQKCAL